MRLIYEKAIPGTDLVLRKWTPGPLLECEFRGRKLRSTRDGADRMLALIFDALTAPEV